MNFSSVSIDSDSHENTMMHANELYLNYIYIIFACIDLYVMAVARKVIAWKTVACMHIIVKYVQI
jgi:hypothetical protein